MIDGTPDITVTKNRTPRPSRLSPYSDRNTPVRIPTGNATAPASATSRMVPTIAFSIPPLEQIAPASQIALGGPEFSKTPALRAERPLSNDEYRMLPSGTRATPTQARQRTETA